MAKKRASRTSGTRKTRSGGRTTPKSPPRPISSRRRQPRRREASSEEDRSNLVRSPWRSPAGEESEREDLVDDLAEALGVPRALDEEVRTSSEILGER